MPNLVIQGNDTHVIDLNPDGDDPIIMVHGLLTSLAVYYFRIALKLSRNHRVILYDLRGHGNSAPCSERFTLDDLSSDLFALMQTLRIECCHLTGYSLGGALAMYVAAHNSELFKSLALIEAPFFTEDSIKLLQGSGVDESLVRADLKAYTRSTKIPVSDSRASKLIDQYHNLVEVGGLLDVIRSCRQHIPDLPFEQLEIPVLLLYGSKSDLSDTGRILAQRLPQAKLYIKRADHNLPVTRSGWVTRRLQKFFG
jgi:pimeloyl-ACP methyl ester carboxylesterase